ncbi:MAG: hypothetical protein RMN24_07495 [Anaerolineae bacterium]|nr:hypothetical protein [Anaerolineae bacterium]
MDETVSLSDAGARLAETAARYWLAYETGLSLRRVKQIVQRVERTGLAGLYQALQTEPELWRVALDLSEDERERLMGCYDALEEVGQRLLTWQQAGIGLLHWDEAAYPETLTRHLEAEARPLLLSYVGDVGLLELPTVLALAGDPPDAAALSWTAETLLALGAEGVLPLLVARPGFAVEVARQLLKAESPLALVVPQGLATYTPPPALARALLAGRGLLLSPLRPDHPAVAADSRLAGHVVGFAQALANALLLITPPYPPGLLPEQPCFLRPGLPKTIGCQTYFTDVEDFFLRLIETPLAAAMAHLPEEVEEIAESASLSTMADAALFPDEPAPDPETLIARLSELGHMPDALKARLRSRS